jgi:hypothetical protein
MRVPRSYTQVIILATKETFLYLFCSVAKHGAGMELPAIGSRGQGSARGTLPPLLEEAVGCAHVEGASTSSDAQLQNDDVVLAEIQAKNDSVTATNFIELMNVCLLLYQLHCSFH